MHERRLSRRQALAGAGSISLGALLAACGGDDEGAGTEAGSARTEAAARTGAAGGSAAKLLDAAPACSVTPELTEGPYYFDVDKVRSDIREGRGGTELGLALRVRDAGSCKPVANAVVEIWHCDALGEYSGFGSAGGPPGGGRSNDKTFLRGAQVTGKDGVAEFTTVYPGWYMGRTVHIHAKIHLDNESALTTQLFFDDDVSEAVYRNEPYTQHGDRDQFNESDGIFDEQLVLKLEQDGDTRLGALNFDVERA